MNMVQGEIRRQDGTHTVTFGGHTVAIDPALIQERPALQGYVDRPVIVGVRPEEMEDAALQPGAPADRRLKTVVELREDMGSEVFVHFGVDADPIITEDTKELAADRGESLEELMAEENPAGCVFVARFDADSTAKEGDRIEVLLDTRSLHFFDPETREAIWADD
jgi:multiple sugar transport system ATP-binding protein